MDLDNTEWQDAEEKEEKRRAAAEGGWICINEEALNCLMQNPNALLLYLLYRKWEQYFPGRLIPFDHDKKFVWIDHPFKKEKNIDKARGTLVKSGLIRTWINEKTKRKEYYQTKLNPRPHGELELINFGAPWAPEWIYFDEDTVGAYKAAHPPFISD